MEDLLRCTLPLLCDEVWPTVRTPSYSPHSRTDFVLPEQNSVLTAKLTGMNLRREDVEKQMAEDIAAYERETRRDSLWVYIFDPQRRLHNPEELERLWSNLEAKPRVRCVISG